jgi:hypothetical protein
MSGGEEPLIARAPFTCSAFAGERSQRPTSTTVYVPVCAYARDDDAVRNRVAEYLSENGIAPGLYSSIIDGFANRPLDSGVGMQAWIALRRYRGRALVTAYLATEANQVYAPGCVPAPTSVTRSRVAACCA